MKLAGIFFVIFFSISSAWAATVEPWVYKTPGGFERTTPDSVRIYATTSVNDDNAELALVVNQKANLWSWAFILNYRHPDKKITKHIDVHARDSRKRETPFPASGGFNVTYPTKDLSVVTVYVKYDSVLALKGKDRLVFRFAFEKNGGDSTFSTYHFSIKNYEQVLKQMEATLRRHKFTAALAPTPGPQPTSALGSYSTIMEMIAAPITAASR